MEIFDEAGILNLREKSIKLTGYLELLINTHLKDYVKIITSRNVDERGCCPKKTLAAERREIKQEVINNENFKFNLIQNKSGVIVSSIGISS